VTKATDMILADAKSDPGFLVDQFVNFGSHGPIIRPQVGCLGYDVLLTKSYC
jgi:hypothetical protein